MLECDRRGARIGIEAPADTNIQREELLLRVTDENKRARATGEHKWLEAIPLRESPAGKALRVPTPIGAAAAAAAGSDETGD